MATLLFFNLPEMGHMHPTLPVVAELVQRGHQVIYYSGETFRSAIEQAGATFHAYGKAYQEEPMPAYDNQFLHLLYFLQIRQRVLEHLIPEVRALHPDALVYDQTCGWGANLAQILDIPGICSMPMFALAPLMLLSDFAKMRDRLVSGAIIRHMRAITRQITTTYHVPVPSYFSQASNPGQCNIVYTSRAFQPQERLYDATYAFVGPSVAPRHDLPDFNWGGFDATRPLLYISLGTLFNERLDFYRQCIRAFVDTPYQVLLSIGHAISPEALGTIPPNIEVRPFVPQLEVLQRATVFLSHGGMNSVSESLYYDVPLVLMPQSADQPWVAKRVEQVGAGINLGATVRDAAFLRRAVDRVCSTPSYAQASKRIGATLRHAGGYQRATEIIEQVLRTQPRFLPPTPGAWSVQLMNLLSK